MNDLKKLVRDVLLGNGQDTGQILHTHKDLFDSISSDTDNRPLAETNTARLLPPVSGSVRPETAPPRATVPASETYGSHPPVQLYDDVDGT